MPADLAPKPKIEEELRRSYYEYTADISQEPGLSLGITKLVYTMLVNIRGFTDVLPTPHVYAALHKVKPFWVRVDKDTSGQCCIVHIEGRKILDPKKLSWETEAINRLTKLGIETKGINLRPRRRDRGFSLGMNRRPFCAGGSLVS